MPTLNWIGKEAVEKHHKEVPYRLLEPVVELSCGDEQSGNLLVQGDNLHALKALLPRYAGKVKCIYIDPPYNTGNEKWAYNDNVNSPEIRKWLGEAVGKEGETLDRHDRWLCMMYPRLLLLRKLLSDDGIIFISIGDDELGHLILMMDEIFGKNNQIANFVWKSRAKPSNTGEAKLKPQNETGLIDEVGQYRHGGVGVMSGDRVVHMAPPANQINRLMVDLLDWLNDSEVHPLIQSSVFHYEFEFIHPFADGNGRMGRLWQTLILSRWNPIFANIPVESLIYQNQKAYYEALQASTDRTDSAPFIEFILQMILDAILSSTDTAQDSGHVTAQAYVQVSDQVQRLISAMKLEDYTLAELMQLVGLNHRATFQKNYLNPAIEADLIERTIPDKPKSPKQRYRLKS
ncbi:Fic family protein [Acinetobacter pittii]|uniref:Fic family protein n=1 Tax=Acinetobacter pittii TaxID=48296 RepID=UPI003896B3B0